MPDGRAIASHEVRVLFMVGVLGGFTTFSTFSLETLNLARNGEWLWAGANAAFSVVLCLAAVWIGYTGATAISR